MRMKFLAANTIKCLFAIYYNDKYFIFLFFITYCGNKKKSFLINLTILGFGIAYL